MSGLVSGLFWKARGLGRPAVPGVAATETEPAIPAQTAVSGALVKAIGARIGDACDEDGVGYRSLAREALADDTELSPKVVQRAVSWLRELGILIVAAGGSGGRGVAPRYDIDLDRLCDFIPADALPKRFRRRASDPADERHEKGDRLTPNSGAKGGHESPERGSERSQKGGMSDPHHSKTTVNNHSAGASASERGGSRPSRRKRRSDPPPADPPKPPKIAVPEGREGQLIRAALDGNDPNIAWKVKPWLGRFRFAECLVNSIELKLVVDGSDKEFRSVFTGALKHLGLGGVTVWMPAFAQRQADHGNARWLTDGPDENWFSKSLRQLETAHG